MQFFYQIILSCQKKVVPLQRNSKITSLTLKNNTTMATMAKTLKAIRLENELNDEKKWVSSCEESIESLVENLAGHTEEQKERLLKEEHEYIEYHKNCIKSLEQQLADLKSAGEVDVELNKLKKDYENYVY